VPLLLYINEKGLAKMEIALCQGKHTYDKRQSLREADDKREMAQLAKYRYK
jgi:SsrA-binding protein